MLKAPPAAGREGPSFFPVRFMYNKRVKLLAASLALSFTLASPGLARAADDSNLLIITVDTLRADRLSCYSRAFVQTPAVDALAAGGAMLWLEFGVWK